MRFLLWKGGKGASGCLYYGFGTHENSVYCREGYAVGCDKKFILLKGGYAVSVTNIFHIKRGTNNHCYIGVVFMAIL